MKLIFIQHSFGTERWCVREVSCQPTLRGDIFVGWVGEEPWASQDVEWSGTIDIKHVHRPTHHRVGTMRNWFYIRKIIVQIEKWFNWGFVMVGWYEIRIYSTQPGHRKVMYLWGTPPTHPTRLMCNEKASPHWLYINAVGFADSW